MSLFDYVFCVFKNNIFLFESSRDTNMWNSRVLWRCIRLWFFTCTAHMFTVYSDAVAQGRSERSSATYVIVSVRPANILQPQQMAIKHFFFLLSKLCLLLCFIISSLYFCLLVARCCRSLTATIRYYNFHNFHVSSDLKYGYYIWHWTTLFRVCIMFLCFFCLCCNKTHTHTKAECSGRIAFLTLLNTGNDQYESEQYTHLVYRPNAGCV